MVNLHNTAIESADMLRSTYRPNPPIGPSLPSASLRGIKYSSAVGARGQRSALPQPPSMMAAEAGKTKVLFVCLGNICRSPTAEAVFKQVTSKAGASDKFDIESCGTGGGSPDWWVFCFAREQVVDSEACSVRRPRVY